MLLSMAMLVVALLPTGDSDWLFTGHTYGGYFTAGIPALCYFKRLGDKDSFSIDQSQAPSMLASILIMAFGYLTRVLKLSKRASKLSRLWLRTKPSEWLRRRSSRSQHDLKANHIWHFKYIVFYISYINFRATFDLFESMLWEVSRSCIP